MFSLQWRSSDAEKRLRHLAERMPFVEARALNKSIASAKTVMVRLVAQDMGLLQKDVRDRVRQEDAAPVQQPVARLWASPKRMPLIEFKARGPEPSRGKGRGVTARLKTGAMRYPQAFIAAVGIGKHRGVFQRGATLDPLAPRFGRIALKTSLTARGKRSSRAGQKRAGAARFEAATQTRQGDRRSPKGWSLNLPIYELLGPSIVHVFQKHEAAGQARAKEQLAKNMKSELQFELRRTA